MLMYPVGTGRWRQGILNVKVIFSKFKFTLSYMRPVAEQHANKAGALV